MDVAGAVDSRADDRHMGSAFGDRISVAGAVADPRLPFRLRNRWTLDEVRPDLAQLSVLPGAVAHAWQLSY